MRITDTAGSSRAASGAVSCLSDRAGDVDSTIYRMNDYGKTREQIADWLESQGL